MPEGPPRYNIAPTQPIVAVSNGAKERLESFVWGLIPFWAKDPKIGGKLCNARAETLMEKNSYKHAFKRRRCLIPADGFYEWKHVSGSATKQPLYIRMKGGKPFAFAGLWETWKSPADELVQSATIITTAPNKLIAPIHNRMPAIVEPQAYDRWLESGDQSPEQLGELSALLKPYPAGEMEAWPISTEVNNVRNDSPELIKRANPAARALFG